MPDDPTPPDPNTPPAGSPAPAPAWYEDARFQPHAQWIEAKGLKLADQTEVLDKLVRTATGAERLLGKGPEKLMERPAEGTPLPEWMRANAALFGLPEAPDKYAINKPELPAGVKWDDTLEAEARRVAHEHAVPPAALNALVKVYGERMGAMLAEAETQAAAANTEMMAALEKDWGQQTPAKIAAARAAAAAIGAKAGLSGEGLAGVMQTLAASVGDAGAVKLFATLGDMMAEDQLAAAPGTSGLGVTPQDARAQLAAFDSPEGPYGKAFARGDQAEMKRLEPQRQALIRIAAGG